jgi:hypothetical protein
MPQKRVKYIIEHPSGETELTVDPKGWDGHEVGFERSDDFGLNVQNVVPLSFHGAGRNILKGIYENKSVFGQSKTRVEKRQNDWSFAPNYTYKHDYSTYKDNGRFVEISGLEDGLAKKFEVYKSTEYTIPLPPENEKIFVDYSGVTVDRTNIIQCGFGKLKEKGDIGEDFYVLGGNRSVRSYTDIISFTDTDGLPYETMTFRMLKTATFSFTLNMFCEIKADGFLWNPSSGTMKIMVHNAGFSGASQISTNFTPTSSRVSASKRYDTFATSRTITVSLAAGTLVSVFYDADNGAYSGVFVEDGANCFLDISNLTESAYQNAKIECFTYEWLIDKLLKAIDPTAVLDYNIPVNPNYTPLLTATPCISNIGQVNGTGELRTSLEEVLKSLHYIECIGIDINGNTMTIEPIQNMYIDTDKGFVEANNIVVEHDTSHQYNSIKVGGKVEDRKDEDALYYPFICEKTFKVNNTIVEAELSLINPFLLDPYEIENYIVKVFDTVDNKDECKFAVMACTQLFSNRRRLNVVGSDIITFQAGDTGEVTLNANITITPEMRYGESKIEASPFSFISGALTPTEWSLQILYNGGQVDSFDGTGNPGGEFYMTTLLANLNQNVSILYSQTYNLAFSDNPSTAEIYLDAYESYATPQLMGNILFRNHTITNFQGDGATMFNVPLTPKRILQKWAKYLAISVHGSDSKQLEFVSSDIESSITSRCDYETVDVVENAPLSLNTTTPLFLPCTISFDTPDKLIDIADFNSEKYKYVSVRDEKRNKVYKGWINIATFALAKKKEKQITLQAKTI